MMKKYEIKGKEEVGVKRFYLPVEVEVSCHHCDTKVVKDFGQDYLSYPTINQNETIVVYCDECENEFEFDVILRISLDVDTDNVRKI